MFHSSNVCCFHGLSFRMFVASNANRFWHMLLIRCSSLLMFAASNVCGASDASRFWFFPFRCLSLLMIVGSFVCYFWCFLLLVLVSSFVFCFWCWLFQGLSVLIFVASFACRLRHVSLPNCKWNIFYLQGRTLPANIKRRRINPQNFAGKPGKYLRGKEPIVLSDF